MTEEIVGIFGDHPSMPTGMSVVLHNLARGLAFHGVRVIFFARFGQEKGFSKEVVMHDYAMDYELVNCQGGVWKPRVVVGALKHYGITNMFCFPRDTLVYSNTPKKIQEIHIGDTVFSSYGEPNKVEKVFRRKYKGELIGIKSRLGDVIWTTPEHPFLTNKFKSHNVHRHIANKWCPIWKTAKELQKKDWLFIPFPQYQVNNNIIINLGKYEYRNSKYKRIIPNEIVVDERLCRFIGYYISEGSATKDGLISFSFNENEVEYQIEVKDLIYKLFNRKARIFKVGRGCKAVRFYSRRLSYWLRHLCGCGARNKHMPNWFLILPNRQLKAILNTYWNGDGYKNIAETASVTLAHQIRLAFLKLGKLVSITPQIRNDNVYWRISLLVQYYGLRKTNKGIWFRITKILKKGYEGEVYNIKTEKNTYLASGISVHNCEDDWFSASGLVKATRHTRIPLHFLTPIDSLPIHKYAFEIFKECEKVYTPNSSYKQIKNGVHLPHGVDFRETFYPEPNEKEKFTFLWVGRDEPRKALGRFILALEKVYKEVDCQAIIHSDWRAKTGRRTAMYLRHKRNLPIIMKQMETGPQEMLRPVYNSADVLVCTSKAGGFEMSMTEGMACGLVPIATDWTFMNEIFNDGEQGFKVPVEGTCDDWVVLWNGKRWGIPLGRVWGNIDVDKLAEKMLWCVNNRDKINEMSNKAASYVKNKYDWMKISAKLAEEILG